MAGTIGGRGVKPLHLLHPAIPQQRGSWKTRAWPQAQGTFSISVHGLSKSAISTIGNPFQRSQGVIDVGEQFVFVVVVAGVKHAFEALKLVYRHIAIISIAGWPPSPVEAVHFLSMMAITSCLKWLAYLCFLSWTRIGN
jgi:hypothetical protein